MPVYPLPGHGPCVSPPGHCSRSMSAGKEDTLMSLVSCGGWAIPPVSEATGYGNMVLFTPASVPQGWCRWQAPARLQLQTIQETNPEHRAALGWEIEFESVCCGYQASTGSDGFELRHDQLRIMSPSKSKLERVSHIHTAPVAQAALAHESPTSNFAEVQSLLSLRSRRQQSAFVAMAPARKQTQAAKAGATAAAKKAALRAHYQSQQTRRRANAPPRGTRPQRQPQQAKKARVTKIPNYLDPMCPIPAPGVTSDGKALPHTALVSGDFVVGTTSTTILLVTNTGSAGTVGVLFNVDTAGVYVDGINIFTIPTLASADSAGGPSSVRAMKFSVSVVNCSNALKRGGRVTYLNSSQRLPVFVDNSYTPIISAIKNSPYRRRITGDLLAEPKHLIGYPVDNVLYSMFSSHKGTLTLAEFLTHVLGAGTGNEPASRPMSIVAYIFDPVSETQDYSVTIRASMYTRWPLTSVPGQSMQNMPTADAKVINRVRDHVESTANDLSHIVEGGVVATTAPRIARAAITRIGGMFGRGAAAANEAAIEAFGVEGAAVAEGVAVGLL